MLSSPSGPLSTSGSSAPWIVGDSTGQHGIDFIVPDHYGELVLLDHDQQMEKAYPMINFPPSWLHVTDEAVYVGRVGDGALPWSIIGRVDRLTLDEGFYMFRTSTEDYDYWADSWTFAPDSDLSRMVVTGDPASDQFDEAQSWIGPVFVNVEELENLFVGVSTEFDFDGGYLFYGENGVVALNYDGRLQVVSREPAAYAVAVDNLVLAQQPDRLGDSAIYPPWRGWMVDVYGLDTGPWLIGVSNIQLRLWDARVIDGKPVALMTTTKWQDLETYEDIVLVDLRPEPSDDVGTMFTKVGRVGSYENLVDNAQFGGDLILTSTTEAGLEARTLTGDVVWSTEIEADRSSFVVVDSEVWVLTPGFEETTFDPLLEVHRRDLVTGQQVASPTIVRVQWPFAGGFCHRPDWNGERLVCDETYGPPFTLDVKTGEVEQILHPAGQHQAGVTALPQS